MIRRTFPTAAFTLTADIVAWLEMEAERRGVSKSHIVREILDAAMAEQKATAA